MTRVELAEDIAAVDRFEARMASGAEELVPAHVVDAILNGDNPVRVWKEHRGLTSKDLAQKAGISAPYLSQIESGKREGRLDALRKIAEALGLGLDDLVG